MTFSCDNVNKTCAFQFWVDQIESFYCGLDTCTSSNEVGYDQNVTKYTCEKMGCKCVPEKFLCGENGSISMCIHLGVNAALLAYAERQTIDLDDFLSQEIKGPASFTCKSGQGCRFEEPAMNDLILTVFGEAYISLDCDGGECLHYSQVPGYVASLSVYCRPITSN